MDILVIPDSHTRPGEDNITRFEALGNYVVEKQPKHIVDLGDHFDLPSQSRYDEGLEAMEGRFFGDDIQAGQEALDAFQEVIDAYNKGRKKKYTPDKDFLFGNHCERLETFLKKNPKYRKNLGFQSFGLEERGWRTTPYREKLLLEGFVFMHHFSNKMGKALSSNVNVGHTIYQQQSVSGLSGHSHLLQVSYNVGADGRKYISGSLGWFGALDQVEGYAKDIMHGWWNGITIIHDAFSGHGDLEFISQERLLREYS